MVGSLVTALAGVGVCGDGVFNVEVVVELVG